RAPGTRIFASIHTPFPKPPPEVRHDAEALRKWGQSAEIQALAQKARGYQLRENADGSWSAEDVAPGQYVLTMGLMGNAPDPKAKPMAAEIPVTVGEGTENLDLGELALQSVAVEP